jgi:hypothetical protein
MAHAGGPLTVRRAVAAAGLAVLAGLVAGPAAAQAPPPPGTVEFLTRYDFHLSAAALSNDDPRFSWDTRFGGELDALDYIVGRTSLRLDYQAILGNEPRAFDPQQGTYVLELSTSVRLRPAEVALVFHHVSRHLSDRAKTDPVDWNLFGVRVLKSASVGAQSVDVEIGVARAVQHSFVDYRWRGDLSGAVRRPIAPRVDAYVRGEGEVIGVDASMNGRGTQAGGLVETGLRLKGSAGAVDLFVGYERRIDAAPFDLQARTWIRAGFRFVRG